MFPDFFQIPDVIVMLVGQENIVRGPAFLLQPLKDRLGAVAGIDDDDVPVFLEQITVRFYRR